MTDVQTIPASGPIKHDQKYRPIWGMYLVTGLLAVVIAFAVSNIVQGPDVKTDQLQTQEVNKLDGRGKWSGYMQ